jgi:acyl carrier protein
MTEQQIYTDLTGVFHDVFDDDTLVLRPDLTADEVPGWDSFTHINLIVAAEGRFHIRFKTAELESMQNVGHFVQLIEQKLAQK